MSEGKQFSTEDLLAALPVFHHSNGDPKHILSINVLWQHLAWSTSGDNTEVGVAIGPALAGFVETVNATVEARDKRIADLKAENERLLVYVSDMETELKNGGPDDA